MYIFKEHLILLIEKLAILQSPNFLLPIEAPTNLTRRVRPKLIHRLLL